jgi:site-specific recombinase XerD
MKQVSALKNMQGKLIMIKSNLLGPWLRQFLLEHLVTERNLAINTQKSYRDMLTLLLPFATGKLSKSVDRLTIDDLSPQLIRQFLSHIELQRSCTITTRNQRLSSIHSLARFIGEHAVEYIDWCAQIRLIPVKKGFHAEITYLDKQEMDAILAAPDEHTSQGRREHTLILFLYNAGARVSEATQLKIGDIDWHSRCVRIVGKGHKERHCPLWQSTLDLLYELTCKRELDEPVFLNRCHQPMTRSGLYTLVKRCANRACELAPSLKNKVVSPHVIRHTTASHLLQAGVDINTIRGWLGHVSLMTTNIYAETDMTTKVKALATCTINEESKSNKSWREPGLMDFLRDL